MSAIFARLHAERLDHLRHLHPCHTLGAFEGLRVGFGVALLGDEGGGQCEDADDCERNRAEGPVS
jgi:hypothetical protein